MSILGWRDESNTLGGLRMETFPPRDRARSWLSYFTLPDLRQSFFIWLIALRTQKLSSCQAYDSDAERVMAAVALLESSKFRNHSSIAVSFLKKLRASALSIPPEGMTGHIKTQSVLPSQNLPGTIRLPSPLAVQMHDNRPRRPAWSQPMLPDLAHPMFESGAWSLLVV